MSTTNSIGKGIEMETFSTQQGTQTNKISNNNPKQWLKKYNTILDNIDEIEEGIDGVKNMKNMNNRLPFINHQININSINTNTIKYNNIISNIENTLKNCNILLGNNSLMSQNNYIKFLINKQFTQKQSERKMVNLYTNKINLKKPVINTLIKKLNTYKTNITTLMSTYKTSITEKILTYLQTEYSNKIMEKTNILNGKIEKIKILREGLIGKVDKKPLNVDNITKDYTYNKNNTEKIQMDIKNETLKKNFIIKKNIIKTLNSITINTKSINKKFNIFNQEFNTKYRYLSKNTSVKNAFRTRITKINATLSDKTTKFNDAIAKFKEHLNGITALKSIINNKNTVKNISIPQKLNNSIEIMDTIIEKMSIEIKTTSLKLSNIIKSLQNIIDTGNNNSKNQPFKKNNSDTSEINNSDNSIVVRTNGNVNKNIKNIAITKTNNGAISHNTITKPVVNTKGNNILKIPPKTFGNLTSDNKERKVYYKNGKGIEKGRMINSVTGEGNTKIIKTRALSRYNEPLSSEMNNITFKSNLFSRNITSARTQKK